MPDYLFPTGDSRPERFLIEYQGIMHSDAEALFYGLKSVPRNPVIPLKRFDELVAKNDERAVYNEIHYFRPEMLLSYLNYGEKIPDIISDTMIMLAKKRYDFSVSTLTSFAGAFRGLMTAEYFKGVTFVFDSDDSMRDMRYLQDILNPDILQEKASTISKEPDESMEDCILSEMEAAAKEKYPYTTVVTNCIYAIQRALTDYEKYGCEDTLFVLRNCTDNCSISLDENKAIKLVERGNDMIVKLIYPIKDRLINGLPLPLSAKFARFENKAFS